MIPRLVVLTDRTQLPAGRDLVTTVRECAGAGLRSVVVREHDLEPGARSALIRELAALPGLTVTSSRIPDRAAYGLHLSADQASQAATGRATWTLDHRYAGGQADRWPLESRSCHSRQDVARAASEGAAWATLSPYALSVSKPGREPLPADVWADHPIPVLALAGVDVDNARAAVAAGAHGVAVMGAVMRADDPASVVSRLLEQVEPPHDDLLLRCALPDNASGTPG